MLGDKPDVERETQNNFLAELFANILLYDGDSLGKRALYNIGDTQFGSF